MNNSEFSRIRQDVLNQPICYRELHANEIVALGENNYQVGSSAFEVTSSVAAKIDRFAGIKKTQTKIALDNYGGQGVANLRNFFGQANVKKGNERIILSANTQTKEIIDAIQIKERMITPDVFFDFAEMFMDKNGYAPTSVNYSVEGSNTVSIMMLSKTEQIMEFSKGDEFVSNGIFLNWNPGEISIGNYYLRLVCENGATQISNHTMMHAYSPDIKELDRLLNTNRITALLKSNLEEMLLHARIAMKSTASVRELGTAVKILKEHGIDEAQANMIIPYSDIRSEYENAGYVMNSENMSHAKSDTTVWEIFNMLTFFASHNDVWSSSDIRRTNLMWAAIQFLMKNRDIIEYYNIF